MVMESKEAFVALNMTEHVGPVRVRQLLQHFVPFFCGKLIRPGDGTGPGRFLGEFPLEPLVGDEENPQHPLFRIQGCGGFRGIGFAVGEERTVGLEAEAQRRGIEILTGAALGVFTTFSAVIIHPPVT